MTASTSKRIAWSDYVFDSKHRQDLEDSHEAHRKESKEKERRLAVSQWSTDVQSLVSSSEWLQRYGLKRNKLSLSQILSQIGFQHRKDYVTTLGKPVASRYADGLFPQYKRAQDGSVYNLTAKKELILHFVDCLMGAIELYKQRMEWLTSESRQIFGVIQERCIVIVLDFGTAAPTEFDLCRDALSMVLVEQVIQIARFNLIRAAQDLMKWQHKPTPVSDHTVKAAVMWLWKLDHMTAVSHTNSAEALLEAMGDEAVEAVYYFAVGDVPVDTKQLLLEKVSDGPCPINTVSFNAREEETIIFLKELSRLASGRFHAFAEKKDYRQATGAALKYEEDGKGLIALNSGKLKGRMPLGRQYKTQDYTDIFIAGVREDVFLIWKELEEARNTVRQVQKILSESDQPASQDATKTDHPLQNHVYDKYLTSEKWLQKYGLKAQKLTPYDALADCIFRHVDGIVDIKTKPEDESSQTDAETKRKVIHARYCDRFVHTLWKDGSVVHIYVSTEKYKQYKEKMRTALRQVEGRIKWLQQGSRGLFGNVFEDNVYILIDTSQSMNNKLPLVKEKIFQLIQEQLRHKKRFNFVKFSAQAVAWQEKLAEVNEENLQDAWLWIKQLEVGSSTNTLKALQIALADTDTQAIYLLTDGRPDQPSQIIFAEVHLHCKIPIHTVSFNCDDIEANKFLYELSTKTEGRFHYYNIYLTDPDTAEFILNKDIHLLKREIDQGEKDLEKVKTFHVKSLMMDSFNEENYSENNSRLFCASEEPARTPHQQTWQTTADSPARRKKLLYAEQTKSSLLRILSHGVKSREESPEERTSPEEKSFSVKKSVKCTTILKDLKMQNVKKASKSSLDISSALWLKTHGLVARRLTIMDALAPTAVPHGTKYIPVLDKHVVSKVFDERHEEATMKSKSKTGQKWQIFVTHKSQKVIARSNVTGFYYPGTVIKNVSSTCALVDFSNGESWDVPVKFTIPVGGAMPCPHLQVGDYVFARTGTQAGNEYYVPAIVIATPERVETGNKLYTVLMFNNRKEHCVRSELIKISQTKYAYSCQYIRTVQMVDYEILDSETTKPYPRSPLEDEGGEEANKSTVEEKREKKKKKRRAVDKRHPREKMSDFDDLIFVSRTEVKQRGRNSQSSNKEEFGASSFSVSSPWCSSRCQTLQSPRASTPSSLKSRCCLRSPAAENSPEPGKSNIRQIIRVNMEQ
ncbi:PREDICTED: von Willebrand factor A domain-containing protein 3B isoform X8 [Lepidothrix coronata]|uniref:von Willebrand factor A domain-containing protein 3B isoform X8 n=1 Tax=Lepidothrix coronata TaxID=321398 RepID=A0A6J0HIZ9_9PASS|nr:PREDICTED: von Willebrand factor A domain-containing protein 3B isoform X8 [Lepidothrix coronata]